MLGAAAVGLDVATDGGKVTCDAYIGAAQNNNGLLVLAPALISGTAITVHVLNMIGLGQPAQDVQRASDEVRKAVGNVVAKSVDEIKKNPIILLSGPVAAPLVLTTAALNKVGIHVQVPPIHPLCSSNVTLKDPTVIVAICVDGNELLFEVGRPVALRLRFAKLACKRSRSFEWWL